jgi:2-keto-4-pentenoate hydratase/2-oxohepta-3-ene-1,7-dioic acid hydratase in catechol pathway
VAWKVGKGDHVHVGEDPSIGVADNYLLSQDLRNHLRERGFTKLIDVSKHDAQIGRFQSLLSEEDLGLHGDCYRTVCSLGQWLKDRGQTGVTGTFPTQCHLNGEVLSI